MSGLETEIKGDPASVAAVGTWLTTTLSRQVDAGVTALSSARTSAQGDWDGPAGAAFAGTMGDARETTNDLLTKITRIGGEATAFANRLSALQGRMADSRSAASAEGLTVAAFTILDPGPGPSQPVDLPPGTRLSIPAADARDTAIAAFNAHQLLVEAWNRAVREVEQTWQDYTASRVPLEDTDRSLAGLNWIVNAATITGGVAGGVLEFNASALRGTGNYFKGLSTKHLERALGADPSLTGKARWYDDLERAKSMGQQADDMVKAGEDLKRTGKTMPLKLGGALAVAGVAYDIYQGKDPVQAATAGGLGFGASVLAGAAIGTAIPVPVVGTVVGAVVGAGVGIFTSGMVDGLFEGGSLGDAAGAGVDALTDTGGAIVDGVGSVGSAIGGLFD